MSSSTTITSSRPPASSGCARAKSGLSWLAVGLSQRSSPGILGANSRLSSDGPMLTENLECNQLQENCRKGSDSESSDFKKSLSPVFTVLSLNLKWKGGFLILGLSYTLVELT